MRTMHQMLCNQWIYHFISTPFWQQYLHELIELVRYHTNSVNPFLLRVPHSPSPLHTCVYNIMLVHCCNVSWILRVVIAIVNDASTTLVTENDHSEPLQYSEAVFFRRCGWMVAAIWVVSAANGWKEETMAVKLYQPSSKERPWQRGSIWKRTIRKATRRLRSALSKPSCRWVHSPRQIPDATTTTWGSSVGV